MSRKKKPQVHLIPTGDPLGRREWYQSRNGGGHPGYSELLAPGSTKRSALQRATERKIREAEAKTKKPPEVYVPRERKKPEVVGWRADDHGPIPGRVREHTPRQPKPRRHWVDALRGAKVDRQPTLASTPAPIPPALSVPVPTERVAPQDVTYATRDGQQEFRKAIIAAYGQCAVTGCQIEDVLDAAHIIPYVDGRSNIISNGLCLRTDIHRLYDRNLIRIGADGLVTVDQAIVCPEYRALHGRALIPPADAQSAPCKTLLNERHKYV